MLEAVEKVIIIDGMTFLKSVIKKSKMKTCADFAESFFRMVCNIACGFDEVRLIFDRYKSTSLKAHMRIKKTQGKTTHYYVKYSTLIKNVSLKDFLSDVQTKEKLTSYLTQRVLHHCRSLANKLNKCIVNLTQNIREIFKFQKLSAHKAKKKKIQSCCYMLHM